MKFRVVRFMLDTEEYETLATSLPRSFTLSEIKELYHARWGIETAFRELKYGLGGGIIRGQRGGQPYHTECAGDTKDDKGSHRQDRVIEMIRTE